MKRNIIICLIIIYVIFSALFPQKVSAVEEGKVIIAPEITFLFGGEKPDEFKLNTLEKEIYIMHVGTNASISSIVASDNPLLLNPITVPGDRRLNWNFKSEGEHVIYAKAIYEDGTEVKGSQKFLIDVTGPVATMNLPKFVPAYSLDTGIDVTAKDNLSKVLEYQCGVDDPNFERSVFIQYTGTISNITLGKTSPEDKAKIKTLYCRFRDELMNIGNTVSSVYEIDDVAPVLEDWDIVFLDDMKYYFILKKIEETGTGVKEIIVTEDCSGTIQEGAKTYDKDIINKYVLIDDFTSLICVYIKDNGNNMYVDGFTLYYNQSYDDGDPEYSEDSFYKEESTSSVGSNSTSSTSPSLLKTSNNLGQLTNENTIYVIIPFVFLTIAIVCFVIYLIFKNRIKGGKNPDKQIDNNLKIPSKVE